MFRSFGTRCLVLAGLVLITALGYSTIRARYLPYGPGFRFHAANVIYPVSTPSALAPIWDQSSFLECFYARADGLGELQFKVYAYFEHRRPHPIFWTLEDLDQPGDPSVARSGSFPATDMHDFGFIRLRFGPISKGAGRLYRFTLKSPGTPFREAGAVAMYATADAEAVEAQVAGGSQRPVVSMLFDTTRKQEFSNIVFRAGTTVSQVFTTRLAYMTSVQIQMTADRLPKDYKLHWSLIRVGDRSPVGSGDLPASSLEDWQFADLFLPKRERCSALEYKLTLSAGADITEKGGIIGLPIFPLSGSIATIISSKKSIVRDGFSAHLVFMDSQTIRGLRLFDQSRDDFLAANENLSSNMTLWYFPTFPAK
jgi:hypothetical protein